MIHLRLFTGLQTSEPLSFLVEKLEHACSAIVTPGIMRLLGPTMMQCGNDVVKHFKHYNS